MILDDRHRLHEDTPIDSCISSFRALHWRIGGSYFAEHSQAGLGPGSAYSPGIADDSHGEDQGYHRYTYENDDCIV